MQLTLALLTCACAALAAPRYEPVALHYHEARGVPEATRIRQLERALDFDGARITGGSVASLGQFPHLGGLLIILRSGDSSVCGSSLLSNTRLLTAAHCWFDGRTRARLLTVVLGSQRLYSGGRRTNTDRVQLHHAYDPRTLNDDVAVITVDWVDYSPTVNRIAYARGPDQYVGQAAVAAGYGRIADTTDISRDQVLSHVTMPVISHEACLRVFGPAIVLTSTLCTDTTGGRSVCYGDSGGPLAVGDTLVGVSSFVSSAGCQRDMPAGFARVSSFASWIDSRM